MNERTRDKNIKALQQLADAAVKGKLIVKHPDGRITDTSQTKHLMKRFTSSQEMYSFIYSVLHTKGLTRPEVNVLNPHPSGYSSEYLFPKDMFLVGEGAAIKNAESQDLPKAFESVFERTGAPAIQIIAGYDANDAKRVNIMLMPQFMKMNYVDISFSGGFSDQEIEDFFKK